SPSSPPSLLASPPSPPPPSGCHPRARRKHPRSPPPSPSSPPPLLRFRSAQRTHPCGGRRKGRIATAGRSRGGRLSPSAARAALRKAGEEDHDPDCKVQAVRAAPRAAAHQARDSRMGRPVAAAPRRQPRAAVALRAVLRERAVRDRDLLSL